MKKIMLLGLSGTSTEASIGVWLGGFGTVCKVDLVRDGDVKAPIAIVEMDISDGLVFFIVSRIRRYWHDRSLVDAYLPRQ